MSKAIADSSAVLALLLGEPGAAVVRSYLPEVLISAVNLAEVISKLTERGMPTLEALEAVETLGAQIVPFDTEQALACAALRPATRSAGLSLGDRACLALAQERNLPALTADTAWSQALPETTILIR